MLKEAERDSRKFQANYAEFEKVMEELIPTILEFRVETDEKKISIKIKYSKIQLNQDQTYPFRIPESYTETKELQPKK